MATAAARAVTEDGWAILALPHEGRRDLSHPEIWELSLKRSRRRRERAAVARANLPASRKVGVAVAATALLAPFAQQTANAQQTTATAAQSTGMLKKGSRGAAVAAVQRQPGVAADGVFGPQTKAAVRAFQARNGLEVDGIVGPMTRAALGGGLRTTSGSSRGPAPSRTVTIAVQQK